MNTDSFTGNTYVAGLAGALLGLKAIPGTTYPERLANLALGFLVAVFVGPAIVDNLHVTSTKVAAGIIFAMGAAGLVAFSAIMEGIKQTPVRDLIIGWLSRSKPPKG